MASAEYVPQKTETRTVVVEEEGYSLKLTVEEAETLLFITTRIGGNSLTTARKHTENIQRALWSAGACANHELMTEQENRAIYFTIDSDQASAI